MPGTGPPPRRGRPPRHSRDDVVRAAVELADVEGLAAVTMRSVAARLGAGAMSLYSYVPDKQALVVAMLGSVQRTVRYSPPTGDWRADLHALAHVQRRLLLQHPWMVDATTYTQPLDEGLLAYLDHGLSVLEPLGLDTTAALETLGLLTGTVITLVRGELNAASSSPAGPDPEVEALLASGRFPRIAAALTASPGGELGRPDVGAEFDRLIDRVLDGLAHRD
jgi:AcrR family transcriptional regulator